MIPTSMLNADGGDNAKGYDMADEVRKSDVAGASPKPAALAAPRTLTPAAERALAEAAQRREAAIQEDQPMEVQGRGGREPVRYGDWEIKGLAVDF